MVCGNMNESKTINQNMRRSLVPDRHLLFSLPYEFIRTVYEMAGVDRDPFDFVVAELKNVLPRRSPRRALTGSEVLRHVKASSTRHRNRYVCSCGTVLKYNTPRYIQQHNRTKKHRGN